MLIGYEIYGSYNGSNMFATNYGAAIAPSCPKCGCVYDFNFINPRFKLCRKRYDLSSTYDLRRIVSQRFKDFCEENEYHGLEFIPFPQEPLFYVFRVNNIIACDVERSNLEYLDFCSECCRYNQVVPTCPVCFKDVTKPLTKGFYASDIWFWPGSEKRPLLIADIDTCEKLKQAKFKGLEFTAIEQ